MGTNYYMAAPHLQDHADESDAYGLHIGKSSSGWVFHWRAHPELGIRSRADWERMFRESGDAMIVNEYGDPVTFAEFQERAFIEHRDPDRRLARVHSDDPSHVCGSWCARLIAETWTDPVGETFYGYEFS